MAAAPPVGPAPTGDDGLTLVPEGRNLRCLACPARIDGPHHLVVHRGRRVLLHPGDCTEHWLVAKDTLFRAREARGALFNEGSVGAGRATNGWLAFGLYVLAGLVCGAACAELAVGRGRGAIEWFFLGLAFNVLALLGVVLLPAGPGLAPLGVPRGLRKVPLTRAPLPCPGCGASNHPAARSCAGCGAALEPSIAPETERA